MGRKPCTHHVCRMPVQILHVSCLHTWTMHLACAAELSCSDAQTKCATALALDTVLDPNPTVNPDSDTQFDPDSQTP